MFVCSVLADVITIAKKALVTAEMHTVFFLHGLGRAQAAGFGIIHHLGFSRGSNNMAVLAEQSPCIPGDEEITEEPAWGSLISQCQQQVFQSHLLVLNWWGVARIELLASKGPRLQRGDGTTHPYVHSP